MSDNLQNLAGAVAIEKLENFTSFDMIALTRKALRIKKIGHNGTLDPMATGVLGVAIGKATKFLSYLNEDKEYVASFIFGTKTTTADITGAILEQQKTNITKEKLTNALPKFVGKIKQIPPMYSAKSVNGTRLYELARKGVEIEREAREIIIYSLELISFDEINQKATIKVNCSKGTYIRTLIEDIAFSLNTIATMSFLNRTKAGSFLLENAVKIIDKSDLDALKTSILENIKPIDNFLEFTKTFVTKAQETRFKNGKELALDRLFDFYDNKNNIVKYKDKEIIKVYSLDDNLFVGLGKISLSQNSLLIERIF